MGFKISQDLHGLSRDATSSPPRKGYGFLERTAVEGLRKLKKKFDDDPMPVMLAAAAFLVASARFIDAVGGIRSKNAYAKRANKR